MKLQRWKIKLNVYDYNIQYLPGKENHVADALSRIQIQENFLEEDSQVSISTAATVHSAQEDIQNHIGITERPLNYYYRQIEFIKGNSDEVEIIKYFQKTRIKITFKEITESSAKELIKEYICTKKSVIYFPDIISERLPSYNKS